MFSDKIVSIPITYNPDYPFFAVDGEPFKGDGIARDENELYIIVYNLQTGELCCKLLYKSSKGLYFKHTGYSSMYLKNFTEKGFVIPFQLLKSGYLL